MNGKKNTWSYAPYRPYLRNVGDIYICRIVPYEDKIHFEWLPEDSECAVYLRKRGEEEFKPLGTTKKAEYDIENLENETDYEFYVAAGNKKSLVRLARTGKSVGTVVNYLHPDDMAYSFSGRYLCSPSLVRHPDGYLLASMDVFAGGYPQNLTLIFRSDDNGESWHYVSELMPCFWGKLFVHKGELYMLSVSTEYGDLLIGKSTDGGVTFTEPTVLLRGSNGKNGNDGVHKNPQNIVIHNGRIYETLEWGTWGNPEFNHAAMVMSADVDADLTDEASWSFSYPVKFEHFGEEVADVKKPAMTIEGTLVVTPDGELLDVMRFSKQGYALMYKVNTENPEAPLEYYGIMPIETAFSKFMIKYDEKSKKYYSVVSRLYADEEGKTVNARNLLALMSSPDLKKWSLVTDLLDYRTSPTAEVGFQYVDFEIEGDDIIYLSRTAINKAHNFHDSNYQTFHRIKNFRSL